MNALATDHATPDQMLHRAIFDGDDRADSPQAGSPTDAEKVGELLDQIGEGLSADDATNLEKLNIARTYGAKLWELKAIVPHGKFQETLAERFPTIDYEMQSVDGDYREE